MDSSSPQILTADHGGPGVVLVLGSHRHIPQVYRAHAVAGIKPLHGAKTEHEENSYRLWKLVGRSDGEGERWRKSGSIWRQTGLPMDPVLLAWGEWREWYRDFPSNLAIKPLCFQYRRLRFNPQCVSCSAVFNSFVTTWTGACQIPLTMEFSKPEFWNGLPFPSPGHLPNPGIKPRSPTLQADSLASE